MKSGDVDDLPERIRDPHVEDEAVGGALRILHAAAVALRSGEGRTAQERIPLEQLERELARVMHIELAVLLVRACDLLRRTDTACDGCADSEISSEEVTRAFRADAQDDSLPAAADGHLEDGRLLALQSEVGESIAVARACGVRVPRVVSRLLAGGPATWPSAERLERWARLLDPDVESRTFEHDSLSR